MAPRQSGTEEDGGLRRLPPGRHGLSREFVTRNQRERLFAGTIAAIAEHGYRDTSVTQIAAAAGVSRRTFYGYFETKEACFDAAFDLFEDHLLEAVSAGGTKARGWAATVRARVATLLEVLAANPDLIRFSLVAPPSAGGEVAARGRGFLEALVGRLIEGHPALRRDAELAALQIEAMQGAIATVLTEPVREDDEEALAELGPQLVELIIAPILGRRKAAAEAAKA